MIPSDEPPVEIGFDFGPFSCGMPRAQGFRWIAYDGTEQTVGSVSPVFILPQINEGVFMTSQDKQGKWFVYDL
jgi:hypothetical protein